MACRLFGAKPLPQPMLAFCQSDSWEQISQKFESEFCHFQSRKCIWKCLPQWRPFCPGGDELRGKHPSVSEMTFATKPSLGTYLPCQDTSPNSVGYSPLNYDLPDQMPQENQAWSCAMPMMTLIPHVAPREVPASSAPAHPHWARYPTESIKHKLVKTLRPEQDIRQHFQLPFIEWQERLKRRNTLGCLHQYAAQNSKHARPPNPITTPNPKGLFPVAHSIWSHHETFTLWNSLCQGAVPMAVF